jgi:hypothetical protein
MSLNDYSIYAESRKINGSYKIEEIMYIPRVIGVISSAATKFLEILSLLGLTPLTIKAENIYCLAEGSGGLSQFYHSYIRQPMFSTTHG